MLIVKNIKKVVIAYMLVLLALIGIFDTAYLTAKHISGNNVVCTIIEGCNAVLSSSYAEVFGIPLALIGLIYYTLVLLCALSYIYGGWQIAILCLIGITGTGLLASVYLVYLQFFIIESVCIYCMASALTTLFLFCTSIGLYIKTKPVFV